MLLWRAEARAVDEPPASDVSEALSALLGGLFGVAEATGPELQREVAAAGGIPFREDVALDFMTRAELRRYLGELFEAEYPAEEAAADAKVLQAFGLLEPGVDLRALRARVMEENVAGFYDERPARRRLYAVSGDRRLSPVNQIVLAHELRHALQDQYVDLSSALPGDVSDFDDRRLAWLSLLEGDATLVMGRFLARRVSGSDDAAARLFSGSMPTPDVPGAPPVVRDQLVRPYFVGLAFAQALVERGGWEAMRTAWSRPPESTEQVLHVEKFLAREAPRALPEFPDPPAGRVVAGGVLGELLIQTLLDGAEPAAAGWGGDSYTLWEVRGRSVLAWRSSWDSEVDRREFEAALLERLSRGRERPAPRGLRCFQGTGGWVRCCSAPQGTVLFVAAEDAGLAEETAARLSRP
jgi:hypothetical protein